MVDIRQTMVKVKVKSVLRRAHLMLVHSHSMCPRARTWGRSRPIAQAWAIMGGIAIQAATLRISRRPHRRLDRTWWAHRVVTWPQTNQEERWDQRGPLQAPVTWRPLAHRRAMWPTSRVTWLHRGLGSKVTWLGSKVTWWGSRVATINRSSSHSSQHLAKVIIVEIFVIE
jgi:hypothetical protein